MDAVTEIQALVRRLNEAWQNGRTDELAEAFHSDVVLRSLEPGQQVVGREDVVDSYRAFREQAVLHAFEIDEATVDVFGATAVALCPYRIDYETEGKRWRGKGRDLLVLIREGHAWSVVWRTLLAGPEEEVRAESTTGSQPS